MNLSVKHEWGHFVQFAFMHPANYLLSVGLPSALSGNQSDVVYYSNPWERSAEWIGGVNRNTGYKSGSLAWGIAQFFAPVPVAVLYALIG